MDSIKHGWRPLIGILTIALMAGCTSGDDTSDDPNSASDNGGTTNPNTGDGNNGNDGGTDGTSVGFGSFDANGDFNEGSISAGDLSPSTGQGTPLSISLRDSNGDSINDDVSVFFSSPCTEDGDADIEPQVVDNTDGQITTTYTPRGCNESDTVTARTSIDGRTLEAQVTLEPTAIQAAALAFISSSNEQIGIQGTGILPPQSTITFRITDDDGTPVPNQRVEFSLGTTVGGISLSRESARTNADGEVTTTVTSGTQATTVQVGARTIGADGQTISGQSRTLAVTTGLADQNSFSISADRTVIEGGDQDGIEDEITVRAADRFNNPVPDGTTIAFQTEGGAIPGSCETMEGRCSVVFVTQNPRPEDGKITILATATGEESFTDSDPSNGRYDEGEAYTDLPEAFLDENYDGDRDLGEPYIDFDSDGSYDGKSESYNGLLCNAGDECAQSDTLTVFQDIEIALSESSLFIDLPNTIALDDDGETVFVFVRDSRGLPPASGTTISAETTQGSIEGPANYTVPPNPGDGPYRAEFRIEPENNAGNGIFRVTVTTPGGTISRDTTRVVQPDDS